VKIYKLLAVLSLLGFALFAWAQNTAGGTIISNTATATFTDSNGTNRTTQSNTVQTTVQTVYDFDISPDDGIAPTATSDFAGYTPIDGLNETNGAIGDEVVFEYTLTNNTNNDPADPLTISLDTVQASGTDDDFDLINVMLYLDDDDGDPSNGYNGDGILQPDDGDGIWEPGEDLIYNPVTDTVELENQGDMVTVFVVAEIPTGVDGNNVALIDLIATNDDAVAAGDTGANVSYESNNIGRVEVDEIPLVGIAKGLGAITNNGDGTYTFDLTFTIENYGNVDLANLQATDDLATTFAAAESWSVDAITSADFTENTNFDGDTDQNLLAGTDTLAIADSGTVVVTVTVEPGAILTGYLNTAQAEGESPDGDPATDDSTDGTDPDDNGDVPGDDGDGDPTNTDSDTPIDFTENPVIGLAKAAGTTVDNGDGTFDTTLTFTVENLGDVEIRNVQITDDLTATFPAPVTFSISTAPASGTLTPNAAFDGDTDQNLLDGTDTLAVGATETVTVTVTFDPNGETGPFNNTAIVTAESPATTPLTDDSDDGSNPDGDSDGDPTNDGDDTPITIIENPVLGVAKRVVSVTALTGANLGKFDVDFEVTVENLGNVDLNNLQVTDDLDTTFSAPATYTIQVDPASADLAENTDFDGSSDINLLDGTDVLEPTEVATITFTVRLDPNGGSGFENVAQGEATSPDGTPVTDDSTDGADPDSDTTDDTTDGTDDDDGTPDENIPTPIDLPENPLLGVAKDLQTVTNNGDGTYTVEYLITLQNYGNVDLSTVQVVEDLAATFTGATISGVSANSTGFTVSGTFDGSADTGVLDGSDTLAVGDSGTITIEVTVEPGSNLGPYNNTVTASADSPEGVPVTDDSTDGTDPDDNGDVAGDDGDNDPTNTDSVTPVTFTEDPVIGIAKAADPTIDAVGFPGQFETTITLTIENLGDVEIRNLQVTDDLDAIFTGAATVEAITSLSSPTLTVNAGFDGGSDINLLDGTDTLAVGDVTEIVFTVRFDPNSETGPFNNTSTITGDSPSTAAVTDTSDDGTDPDTDGDGEPNESGENDPTPISFTEVPVIGVAKAATITDYGNTDPDLGALGPFEVTLEFTLENFGNVDVINLHLVDDLDTAFGAGNYSITSGPTLTTAPATSTINFNAGFDGSADTEILASATSNLDIGETAVIELVVEVTDPGAYTNVATATGEGPGGTPTTDDSDDGNDPDDNGNDDPTDDNDPTPINLDALALDKSVRTCDDADCATVVDATGNEAEPGQYLEYTIVAENVGDQDLTSVIILDEIPTWTTPIAGSAQYVDGANTTATIECSTDGGTSWAACPAGPSTTVTNVRLNVGILAAGDTATLTFVVLVP
jgi:uncharacterized repeat protein (TIGR01451 family)